MEKVGRNDPCPCGSGKKFKKCCEEKARHKTINAQLISDAPGASATSRLFQRAHPPAPPAAPPEPAAGEKIDVL